MNTVIAFRPMTKEIPRRTTVQPVVAQPRFGIFAGSGAGSLQKTEELPIEERLNKLNSEIIKADNHARAIKNRTAYQQLQAITFDYSVKKLNALDILEVLYKRGYSQTLGSYFHQLKNLSEAQQKEFVSAVATIEGLGFIGSQQPARDSESDVVPKGKWTRYHMTDSGNTIINQYYADQKRAKEQQAPPVQAELPKGSGTVLKTLLTPTAFGVTPLALLKELSQQLAKRNFVSKWIIGYGVAERKLLKALPGATAAQLSVSMELLKKWELVSIRGDLFFPRPFYNLTEKGKQLVAEDNLWASGLVKPEDVKAWIDERLQNCKEASAELARIMGDFETTYQNADEDYKQTESKIQELSAEARSVFQQSKETNRPQTERDQLLKDALAKKEEAKTLQEVLDTEKQQLRQEATYQLNLALNIEEKVSAEISAQYKQAQADQVTFKMTTLQKGLANLGNLVARLTRDGASMADPVQGLRQALQREWDAKGIDLDPDTVKIQRRIKARLERNRQESLKNELEAELQEITASAETQTAPVAETASPPSALQKALNEAAPPKAESQDATP